MTARITIEKERFTNQTKTTRSYIETDIKSYHLVVMSFMLNLDMASNQLTLTIVCFI